MAACRLKEGPLEQSGNARLKTPRRARIMGWLWASVLRLLCATWRKRYEGFEAIDRERAQGTKMMLCFWHGKYLPVFALCRWLWIEQRGESACVFTSRSARGQVISEICRHFGLDCVQIPDMGRKQSYQLMRKALAEHTAGVIAVDGPLGPYRQVKQGAIRLAAELGYLLVPASTSAQRKWVMAQRWDRMEVPLFFSRVGLSMGQPIPVPPDVRKDQIRALMDELCNTLEALERRAHSLIDAGVAGER